jgi:CBS domain-containing protein
MKLREVMTKDVKTCKIDDKLSDCANWMKEYNVGFMPVVDKNGQLVGAITDRDIAIRAVAKNVDLANANVGSYMTPNPIVADQNWDVEDVADLMADNQVRRLPVVQDGLLIGIVSLGDLAVDVGEAELVAETIEKISIPTR